MKLETTTPNYCATVVRLNNTYPLENSDNLVWATFFGYNIITQKDIKLWELYLFFSTETELDEKLLYNNNLYSSASINKDVQKKGYIDKSWRVKAIKLRWNKSNGLILPLSSLSYLGINYNQLKEWDTFNKIDTQNVCNKYYIRTPLDWVKNKQKWITKKYERIDWKHFPEHFETDQYFRNVDKYKVDDIVVITQKLHGTSCRLANLEVNIKPNLLDRLLGRQRKQYDYLAWSRRVIKDLKSEKKFEHYYKTENLDIYNRVLERYKDAIPKGVIIYWEVIGYQDWTEIQKGYTYNCNVWEFEFYVYRIVMINKDWLTVDYSWNWVKEFCRNTWMKYCPEIEVTLHTFFNANNYMDIKYNQLFNNCLPLSDTASVDEGVCIRREGINPYITKAKSPEFYIYESKQLDQWVVDLETNQI